MDQLIGMIFVLAAAQGPSGNGYVLPEMMPAEKPPQVDAAFLSETKQPQFEPGVGSNGENWCRAGSMVMIPDGREGRVTSTEGNICRVLAYGEGYVSLWTYDLIEPVYDMEGQNRPAGSFGH